METANKEAELELADVGGEGEQLNPPKPRPPSPEYDDPEGKEVHEDNSHLFRVCYWLLLLIMSFVKCLSVVSVQFLLDGT